LNPIELIWAQVKGFVAENNTTFRLKDVKELVYGGVWQNYKGSLGEGRRPCIRNRKGVWVLINSLKLDIEYTIIGYE
jgi:hypothetical protein